MTSEEEQYFRDMLSLVCACCAHCWDAEKCKECLFSKLSELAIEALKNQRKHGEWIERPNDHNHFMCSECGKPCDMVLTASGFVVEQLSDFCPDCGADMRQKEGDHNDF